jgi:hypothetical protein
VNNAQNHPSVIAPTGVGWFFGKCGSIAFHASSDNESNAI